MKILRYPREVNIDYMAACGQHWFSIRNAPRSETIIYKLFVKEFNQCYSHSSGENGPQLICRNPQKISMWSVLMIALIMIPRITILLFRHCQQQTAWLNNQKESWAMQPSQVHQIFESAFGHKIRDRPWIKRIF